MAIKQISEQLKEAQVDRITLRLCFLYFPRLKINLLKVAVQPFTNQTVIIKT